MPAAAKVKGQDALKQLIIVNHVAGKKEYIGYRYIPSANVSVQGQDAVGAWKATAHILKARAAHPGEGRLRLVRQREGVQSVRDRHVHGQRRLICLAGRRIRGPFGPLFLLRW